MRTRAGAGWIPCDSKIGSGNPQNLLLDRSAARDVVDEHILIGVGRFKRSQRVAAQIEDAIVAAGEDQHSVSIGADCRGGGVRGQPRRIIREIGIELLKLRSGRRQRRDGLIRIWDALRPRSRIVHRNADCSRRVAGGGRCHDGICLRRGPVDRCSADRSRTRVQGQSIRKRRSHAIVSGHAIAHRQRRNRLAGGVDDGAGRVGQSRGCASIPILSEA